MNRQRQHFCPMNIVGKPALPVVLQRALKKAEGLTDLS
jgi:hypothetical protein